NPRPHPLTPSPPGEGELNLLLPSPGGRGAGGEGSKSDRSMYNFRGVKASIRLKLGLNLVKFDNLENNKG
uniref:hypothetical protein n=1 Tax=Calothrix sp. FACHB-1219 TaxID=2692778 RepID=UPI001A7E2BCF